MIKKNNAKTLLLIIGIISIIFATSTGLINIQSFTGGTLQEVCTSINTTTSSLENTKSSLCTITIGGKTPLYCDIQNQGVPTLVIGYGIPPSSNGTSPEFTSMAQATILPLNLGSTSITTCEGFYTTLLPQGKISTSKGITIINATNIFNHPCDNPTDCGPQIKYDMYGLCTNNEAIFFSKDLESSIMQKLVTCTQKDLCTTNNDCANDKYCDVDISECKILTCGEKQIIKDHACLTVECKNDAHCSISKDYNCDGRVDTVPGTCNTTAYTCSYPEPEVCEFLQLRWNTIIGNRIFDATGVQTAPYRYIIIAAALAGISYLGYIVWRRKR